MINTNHATTVLQAFDSEKTHSQCLAYLLERKAPLILGQWSKNFF